MFLKKELIQIPFSKVRSFDLVYDDEEDLKFGIINLCRLLNKGMFLIQVFLGDSINELLKARRILRHAAQRTESLGGNRRFRLPYFSDGDRADPKTENQSHGQSQSQTPYG